MNKVMILAILVAYKAFNDKSLTIAFKKGEIEHVINNIVIDSIDNNIVNTLYGDGHCFSRKTININDITGIQFQK